MRELKFRVWNKHSKDWLILGATGIDCITGHLVDYEYEGVSLKYQEWYVIEQYTGLKDKNGKKIYEGDIMSDKTVVEFSNDPDVIGSCGCCVGRFFGSGFVITTNARPYELEVIGNIHENPDLLKEVNKI